MKRTYRIDFENQIHTVQANNISVNYDVGITLMYLDNITTAVVPKEALITLINDEQPK